MIDQNPEAAHDDNLKAARENDPKVVHVEVQDTPNVNVNDGDAPLRRSQRIRRSAISSDYIVYLQEHKFDVGDTSNRSTY